MSKWDKYLVTDEKGVAYTAETIAKQAPPAQPVAQDGSGILPPSAPRGKPVPQEPQPEELRSTLGRALDTASDMSTKVLQGFTGGFSDEITGKIDVELHKAGLSGLALTPEGLTDEEIYEVARNTERNRQQVADDRSPVLGYVADTTGGMISPVGKALGGLKGAAKLAGAVAEGALGGLGESEGDLEDQSFGTAVGGVVAGALGVGGRLADKAGDALRHGAGRLGKLWAGDNADVAESFINNPAKMIEKNKATIDLQKMTNQELDLNNTKSRLDETEKALGIRRDSEFQADRTEQLKRFAEMDSAEKMDFIAAQQQNLRLNNADKLKYGNAVEQQKRDVFDAAGTTEREIAADLARRHANKNELYAQVYTTRGADDLVDGMPESFTVGRQVMEGLGRQVDDGTVNTLQKTHPKIAEDLQQALRGITLNSVNPSITKGQNLKALVDLQRTLSDGVAQTGRRVNGGQGTNADIQAYSFLTEQLKSVKTAIQTASDGLDPDGQQALQKANAAYAEYMGAEKALLHGKVGLRNKETNRVEPKADRLLKLANTPNDVATLDRKIGGDRLEALRARARTQVDAPIARDVLPTSMFQPTARPDLPTQRQLQQDELDIMNQQNAIRAKLDPLQKNMSKVRETKTEWEALREKGLGIDVAKISPATFISTQSLVDSVAKAFDKPALTAAVRLLVSTKRPITRSTVESLGNQHNMSLEDRQRLDQQLREQGLLKD